MKRLIKFVSLLLSASVLCSTAVFASDGGETVDEKDVYASLEFEIPAKSAILIEESTGTVLYEKNAHEKLPPASITKIMTMLLVMEALDSGKCSLDEQICASANAVSMGGTQIWLKENEQMSLRDLLKACAVGSANDAAMALAEHIGGSEEGFVAMMNNKASELSMNDTVFVNPTGLDAQGHLSSAHDIAVMSRELLKHKQITEFTSIWMDSLRGGKTELVNTNKLVRFYKGCTGLKTGTTNGAGSCVSVSATKNDMSLISVVMGCAASADRFNAARKLLDSGFSTYTVYSLDLTGEPISDIAVTGGVCDTVGVSAGDNVGKFVIEKQKAKGIKKMVELPETLEAPIEKGQVLGEVIITSGDEEIARISLSAESEVEKMTVGRAFIKLIKKACVL